ncbi:heterokaryon incompatibility protein-domain-containing protein [Rhypophila decipiens]|uniref:Heterokaryon incompatibility protein-domain-containing protein n=1 Tax=Rhypophila decipiens TaxID=261697 RepID=A0AAN6XTG7_9PEZI|nr:heterokaryon incompatibility protein-domain-containing protein [Rhypophila decipiens]
MEYISTKRVEETLEELEMEAEGARNEGKSTSHDLDWQHDRVKNRVTAASSVIYSPLDSSQRQVRLARLSKGNTEDPLSVNLVLASLDSLSTSPSYEALSYAWGSTTPAKELILNGHTVDITPNLHAALSVLRSPTHDRFLWVDAICINQEDSNEQSEQVRSMRDVYSSATRTVVWLGELGASREAMEFLATLETHASPADCMAEVFKPQGNERAKTLVNGLWELLVNRPYWKRRWIVQELVCGTNIPVYCGSMTIPLEVLRKVPDVLKDAVGNLDRLYPELSEYTRMADNIGWLEIDYSLSTTAVYRGAARAIIEETSSLDILCSMRSAGRDPVTGDYRARQPFLPSWAPDWNIHSSTEFGILGNIGPMRDRAAGDTPAKVQFVNDDLIVEGLAIAEIFDSGVPFVMEVMGSVTWEGNMKVLFQWREKVQIYALHQSTSFPTGRRMSQCSRDKDQGSLKKWREKAPLVFSTPQTQLKTSSPPLITTSFNEDGESLIDKFYRLLDYFQENEADTEVFSNESTWARWWMMVHGRPQDDKTGSSSRAAARSARGKGGTRRKWWVTRKEADEPVGPMELSEEENLYFMFIYDLCAGRRLFFFEDPRAGHTGQMNIGLCPQEAEKGDVVCVILGCPLPIVLRPVDDDFVVVGEDLVDDYMQGEALEGTPALGTFTLR